MCSDALYHEFEDRASDLACSVDWLLAEAMQRLLAETRTSSKRLAAPPAADVLDQDDDRDLATTGPWERPDPDDTLEAVPVDAQGRVATHELEPIVLCLGGRRVRVDRDRFVIGRRGADLVVDHEAVSRRHAILEASEDGWMLFDLGSTNGVVVNGNFVVGALVEPGDVMSLGPVPIVIEHA